MKFEDKLQKYPFLLIRTKDEQNDEYPEFNINNYQMLCGVKEFETDATEMGKFIQVNYPQTLYQELFCLGLNYEGVFTVKGDVEEYNINHNYTYDYSLKIKYPELFVDIDLNEMDRSEKKERNGDLIRTAYGNKRKRNKFVIYNYHKEQ